jgi:hypothetical protein
MLAAMARALSTNKVPNHLLALAMVIALVSATDMDASSDSAPDIVRVVHECVFPQGTIAPLQLSSPMAERGALATPTPELNASPAAFSINSRLPCDADGDQLPDAEEVTLGTDPQMIDTDGDGLSDTAEYLGIGSSPLISDTDGDGHSDGQEVGTGSDPNDPASPLPGE